MSKKKHIITNTKETILLDSANDKLFSGNQIIVIIALLILTYFSFSPALDNDFVDWDDGVYVLENQLVLDKEIPISDVFKQAVSLNYHPLTILSMRWNANECKDCLNGISSKPFIHWNILIHLLNSFLVLLLSYKLSHKSFFVGLFCASIFAVHPMHVESVVWISERKDVLYVMFFLLSLLSFVKYLDTKSVGDASRKRWFLLTVVFFILSCFSKAMAVVLPLVLILIDFYKNKEVNPILALKQTIRFKNLLKFIPLFGVSLLFGLMASSIQQGGDFGGLVQNFESEAAINDFDVFTIYQRFQFAAYGFSMYIIKFFAPFGLSTFYPYPNKTEFESSNIFLGSLIFVVVLFCSIIFSFKKSKIYFFGIGFFFFTVVLVLQFVSVGTVIMADRYSYLPYVGLSFLLAILLDKYLLKKYNYIIFSIFVIIILFFVTQTRTQVDRWQDSETLWSKVIEQYPNIEQVYSVRGNYYGKMSSRYMQIGDSVNQQKFRNKAEKDFIKAIQLNSNRVDVYEGMGNIYAMKNEPVKAINMYSKAIKIQINKVNLHFNRAIAYSIISDNASFLKDMNICVELDKKPLNYLYRGFAKQALGDKIGAINDYEAVLKMETNNKIAIERLAFLRDPK